MFYWDCSKHCSSQKNLTSVALLQMLRRLPCFASSCRHQQRWQQCCFVCCCFHCSRQSWLLHQEYSHLWFSNSHLMQFGLGPGEANVWEAWSHWQWLQWPKKIKTHTNQQIILTNCWGRAFVGAIDNCYCYGYCKGEMTTTYPSGFQCDKLAIKTHNNL